jgi:cyclopropane fatty-acyl-phospholipid synthase-like methyltransferase
VSDRADFYESYGAFKDYATPGLKAKHIRRYDALFWDPAGCAPDMRVLELGCGLGQFLLYLRAKGVGDFLGIDQDAAIEAHLPDAVHGHFKCCDIETFLSAEPFSGPYDRIVLFDVLEHFTAADGAALLGRLGKILTLGGRIVVKVPNMGSPWGAQHQYGDLTHKCAYTPKSLRQLALSAGLRCIGCHPVIEGSPSRRIFDTALHGLLSRVLLSPPEIWTANFLAVLETEAP